MLGEEAMALILVEEEVVAVNAIPVVRRVISLGNALKVVSMDPVEVSMAVTTMVEHIVEGLELQILRTLHMARVSKEGRVILLEMDMMTGMCRMVQRGVAEAMAIDSARGNSVTTRKPFLF